MSQPIITSILDTDLYKFSMQKVVFHQYPSATVRYQFRCRNKDVKLGYLRDEVTEEINTLRSVTLQHDESVWMEKNIPFLNGDYIDFLRKYIFNPDYVYVARDDEDNLVIEIIGPWVDTILFEVPVLAIVNELHFRHTADFANLKQTGIDRLSAKVTMLKSHPRLIISEFGTRRRYSKEWQQFVFSQLLKNCPQVVGTSNVKLAMDFNSKAQGTMAHEYISAHIGLVDKIRYAQKRALHVWQQEYDKDLGTALTDTFTTKAFWQDFDKTLSEGFSGLRHDSGDPIEFGNAAIAHYKQMGVDPRLKTLIFSDGLNIPKSIEIFERFTGLIGLAFGVGTDLTNDLGIKALNIVMKLIECNGKNCVKLSDNEGKHIGDFQVIKKVIEAYNIK